MSHKKKKKKQPKSEKTRLFKSVGNGLKSAAKGTSNIFKSIGSKTKEFVSNIKLGQKMAQDMDNMTIALKEAADKAELLETANNLEAQAKSLRAIARSI